MQAAMARQPDDRNALRAMALARELWVVAGKLKRALRAQGNAGDLTPSQVAVLVHLERDGPATVTTLARAEGVRSQSMGATVTMLEAAGLVSGTPDPADGRQTVLSLTAACRKMLKTGRAAREDWLFGVVNTRLSAKEREQLASAIELLKRIVEP
jgi:DNA-binding MarR family transcriptional regulator